MPVLGTKVSEPTKLMFEVKAKAGGLTVSQALRKLVVEYLKEEKP